MSTPKSVIKINKNGVRYESFVDRTNYYIHELTRAALKDVGKFVVKKFKQLYYGEFKKHTGNAGKSVKYNVWSSASTKYPKVQIGLKTPKVGFYSMMQEFGTSQQPKLGLLTRSVQENIPEIIKIESQYLSSLEEEAIRLSIKEDEVEGDDED